jgi:hypothetical protein
MAAVGERTAPRSLALTAVQRSWARRELLGVLIELRELGARGAPDLLSKQPSQRLLEMALALVKLSVGQLRRPRCANRQGFSAR